MTAGPYQSSNYRILQSCALKYETLRGVACRIVAVMLLLLISAANSEARAAPDDYLSLKEVKRSIQIAIRDSVRQNTQPPFFLVRKVELKLRGTHSTDGSGGFHIPIFSADFDISGGGGTTVLDELAMSLEPSGAVVTGVTPEIDLSSVVAAVKEAFVDDLLNADESIESSERNDSNGDLPPLSTSGFVYTHHWALKRNLEGKVNVLVVSFGANIATEYQQTIVFHLCRTENKQNCASSE